MRWLGIPFGMLARVSLASGSSWCLLPWLSAVQNQLQRQASARMGEISSPASPAHISDKIQALGRRCFSSWLFVCTLRVAACAVVEIPGDRQTTEQETPWSVPYKWISDHKCPFFPAMGTLLALPCPTPAHPFQICHPKLSFLWLTRVLSHLWGSADAQPQAHPQPREAGAALSKPETTDIWGGNPFQW